MVGFRTAIIALTCSAMGAAAIKMTQYGPEAPMDADCRGNSTCVTLASKLCQSLSTTTKFKLSDQEMDSVLNDGFVYLRGVLTNQKLLEKIGQELINLFPTKISRGLGSDDINRDPYTRALINHTNVRSIFEQFAQHTFGNIPEQGGPRIFEIAKKEHHRLDDLSFGTSSPWTDCFLHMDDHSFTGNISDNGKVPNELILWIALSHATQPLATFRESHLNWGSAWGKCANKSNAPHRHCFDFDCTKKILGGSKLWAADVEPGDMILFNKRTLHAGIQQETDRVALSLKWTRIRK